jgi:hypothetical protein
MRATAIRYFYGVMNRLPYVRTLITRQRYLERFCPLEHFYSPIPAIADLQTRESQVFAPPPAQLPGIDLNPDGQIALLRELGKYHSQLPFPHDRSPDFRYYYNNNFFGIADVTYLFCMLRHLRPRRVIEVGSGYSSAAILDTVDRFLPGQTRCTFIEPYPEHLLKVVRVGPDEPFTLVQKMLQDVELGLFDELGAGDLLFIDSSHVSKAGSDVQTLYFEILPRLAPGVYVHIHDIFYPFEYPKNWIYDGRSWNEAYLVRALLQHNDAFEICLFGSYLELFARDQLQSHLPSALKDPCQSLWLRKLK